DHAVTAASRHTEILISGPAVNSAKGVPVKSVRDVELKNSIPPLPDASSFDDGKTLVLESWTSPPGDHGGKISENVTTTGRQGAGSRLCEWRAVDWLRPHGTDRPA